MKKKYDKVELEKVQEEVVSLTTRAGTFALTTNGGDVFDNPEQRDELRMIMESLIIIQCTHIVGIDQLAYVCLCEQFRPIEKGDIMPSYVPMFEVDDVGKRTKVIWEENINYFPVNLTPN